MPIAALRCNERRANCAGRKFAGWMAGRLVSNSPKSEEAHRLPQFAATIANV